MQYHDASILYLTPTPFWQADGGSKARVAALANALRTQSRLRNFALTIASIAPRGTNAEHQTAIDFWIDPGEPRPYPAKISDYDDANLRARVSNLINDIRPTAILCDYATTGLLLPAHTPGTIRAVDTHDVLHQRAAAFAAANKPHWIRLTETEEANLLANFDTIVAIQQHDALTLANLINRNAAANARVIVAGHGLDLHRISAKPPRTTGPVTIGFLGGAAEPNRIAARRLTDGIWPRIRTRFGKRATLLIAGEVGPAAGLSHDPATGVEVAGTIPNLDAFYNRADIIANPVNFGGGLKIKSVEALAHARPLVATPEGVRGMPNIETSNTAVIAAKDDNLAEAIAHLIENPRARAEASHAARTYAETYFDARHTFTPLIETLTNAAPIHEQPNTERRAG